MQQNFRSSQAHCSKANTRGRWHRKGKFALFRDAGNQGEGRLLSMGQPPPSVGKELLWEGQTQKQHKQL